MCLLLCDIGPMSVPAHRLPMCCMHVLEDSELKYSFPGQQLSQLGFGGEPSFRLWTFLKVPYAGGGWRPRDRELPAWVHGGAPQRLPPSVVWPPMLCMPAPAYMCACVCACFASHASLVSGAGASVGMSRGTSVQPASILPQVLHTFSLPPNSSWT